MSGHDDFNEEASRRTYTAPYSSHHPVPTVQGYEAHQEERKTQADVPYEGSAEEEGRHVTNSTADDAKSFSDTAGRSRGHTPDLEQPYTGRNLNAEDSDQKNDDSKAENHDNSENGNEDRTLKDTSEALVNDLDPRQKRKHIKRMKRDHAEREVTDPVTHLRVTIHDQTESELKNVPENLPPAGSQPRTSTGLSAASKSASEIEQEREEQQAEHSGMEKLFPPPNFEATRQELEKIYSLAITFGLGLVLSVALLVLIGSHLLSVRSLSKSGGNSSLSWPHLIVTSTAILLVGLGLGGGSTWIIQGWVRSRVRGIWEDEVWDAAKAQDQERSDSPTPESTQWLNSLLASVWPLINPDLFTSLADTLEDVMQASLPKLVRMISVEDLAQGSEALRILGVRWLPTGAAAKDVSVDGTLKPSKKEDSDRKVPGQGELDDDSKSNTSGQHKPKENNNQDSGEEKKEEGEEENVAEGMEAEEGDFVNVEVAFSYRASSSGKTLRHKAKNAHLYLAFYLPGGIRFPVWVELRGIVGTLRMRLQLCPDPPFFALCTLTLLGQPKADLSCIPMKKHGLNIMDVPIISSFVQSSIDAALAEYVAPKSLTLDLKDMLVGDDFKKDTNARGVVMVRIKSAKNFKEGDGNLGPLRKGSSDAYVAVGWAKFGKPIWSTRIIISDMKPVWDETAFILVGPEELNAAERLRLQLWDSDRMTADDDLGRIEVDLKELMHSPQSKGKMWDRQDGFIALDAKEKMPGSLEWSVGYFQKCRIQEEQLRKQNEEPDINTLQQLKDKISQDVTTKIREANGRDESHEIDQQKAQDLKVREDKMIISTPPLENYPTGIFSIQIHQITGLEFEKIQKNQGDGHEGSDSEEGSGDLPSSYCNVILNHQKIFKTRTKPKNANPFFNAGIERLIRDWRSTEVIISVRDSRVHEQDPLLGIVYLPLAYIFQERSQLMDSFPLVGGIGYGRVRISMVFRSIQLQAPRELLGWDYGTVEITGPITSRDIATSLRGLRLKIRTSVQHGKVYSTNNEAHWVGKKERPVRLAVRKRYSSCLIFEFRKNSVLLDKTAAFAVLWLKDVPDDEEKTVSLSVWNGHGGLKRAEANCIEEMGEKVGDIDVPLKYWHGLSGNHKKLASNNPNLQDVIEVLSTASDNKEAMDATNGENSDSDSSDDGARDAGGHRNKDRRPATARAGSDEYDEHNEEHGSRGPWDQIKDYKDHSDQLHRQHRGIMQWKGARTAQYVKTKMMHGKDHLVDGFKRHERDPGIETEV